MSEQATGFEPIAEALKDPYRRIRFLLSAPSGYDEDDRAIFDDVDMNRLNAYALELKEQRDQLASALRGLYLALVPLEGDPLFTKPEALAWDEKALLEDAEAALLEVGALEAQL